MEQCKEQALPIAYTDFSRVDMRVGTIVQVDLFPEAKKPSYQLVIDFGQEIGRKKSSAQITSFYKDPNELSGKQVLAVVNFPAKQIGPFRSEVLVLGLEDIDGSVILVRPDKRVPNGKKLF